MMRFKQSLPLLILVATAAIALAPFPKGWTQTVGPSADDYPASVIRVIVPFAPGGATDIIARILAQQLSTAWHASIRVENHPGASGEIGTAIVAHAPADGYTALVVGSGFVVNPVLYDSLPYDAVKDFSPVTVVAASPNILVVNPSLPAASVSDLVALARTPGSNLTFASPGIGTLPHLSGERFALSVGIHLTHVPFNGAGPAITATIAGHTPLAFVPVPEAIPYILDGTLRALAVTSKGRLSTLPDVPTMGEVGVLDQEAETFQAILFPAKTSELIIRRWYREVQQIVRLPEIAKRLASIGFRPVVNSPEAFSNQITTEIERWRRVVAAAHIKVE